MPACRSPAPPPSLPASTPLLLYLKYPWPHVTGGRAGGPLGQQVWGREGDVPICALVRVCVRPYLCFVSVSLCVAVCLSACLCVWLCVSLHASVWLCVSLHASVCGCVSHCMPLRVAVSLCMPLCVALCLAVCVCARTYILRLNSWLVLQGPLVMFSLLAPL